jgi:hypothetical protein
MVTVVSNTKLAISAGWAAFNNVDLSAGNLALLVVGVSQQMGPNLEGDGWSHAATLTVAGNIETVAHVLHIYQKKDPTNDESVRLYDGHYAKTAMLLLLAGASDFSFSAVQNATSANPNPGLEGASGGETPLAIAIAAIANSVIATAGPSGWDGFDVQASNGAIGYGVSLAIATKQLTDNVVDPPFFTAAPANWAAATILVE